MRNLHPGKALSLLANAFGGRRLRLDDISDYMRRDIGIVDGRPTICGNGFAETDARSRGFDRLAQTRFAS